MVTVFMLNSIREIGAVRNPYQSGETVGWLAQGLHEFFAYLIDFFF